MSAFDLTENPIYPLFTNTGIINYFDNNWDMFIDGRNDMSDEDYDRLLTHIANASTDGRLEKELSYCFQTWIGDKFNDMLYETLDDFISTVVAEFGIDTDTKED